MLNREIRDDIIPEPLSVPDILGSEAVAAADIEVYKIPKPDGIKPGSVVTVRYEGVPEQKAVQTVWIASGEQAPPDGMRALRPQTPLAHALMHHKLAEGNTISFEVNHKTMVVEIMTIDGRPVA